MSRSGLGRSSGAEHCMLAAREGLVSADMIVKLRLRADRGQSPAECGLVEVLERRTVGGDLSAFDREVVLSY